MTTLNKISIRDTRCSYLQQQMTLSHCGTDGCRCRKLSGVRIVVSWRLGSQAVVSGPARPGARGRVPPVPQFRQPKFFLQALPRRRLTLQPVLQRLHQFVHLLLDPLLNLLPEHLGSGRREAGAPPASLRRRSLRRFTSTRRAPLRVRGGAAPRRPGVGCRGSLEAAARGNSPGERILAHLAEWSPVVDPREVGEVGRR